MRRRSLGERGEGERLWRCHPPTGGRGWGEGRGRGGGGGGRERDPSSVIPQLEAWSQTTLSLLRPGVYLPLLWEQSFCWKSPIALGYTRGHFSALVAMENDGFDNRGAGANLNTDDDVTVTFLPLVDSDRKLLHVHFLSAQEVRGGAWCATVS